MESLTRVMTETQKKNDDRFDRLTAVLERLVAAPRAEPKPIVAQLAELTPLIAAVSPFFVESRRLSAEERARGAVREEEARKEAAHQRDEMMKLLMAGQEKSAGTTANMMQDHPHGRVRLGDGQDHAPARRHPA